jgi:hypothetical protein
MLPNKIMDLLIPPSTPPVPRRHERVTSLRTTGRRPVPDMLVRNITETGPMLRKFSNVFLSQPISDTNPYLSTTKTAFFVKFTLRS